MELLVTFAISSIVLAIAGGILLSSFQLFSSSASENEAKMIGDNVESYLSDQLTYATGLQMIEENDTATAPVYDNRLQIIDGKLYRQTALQSNTTVFNDAFYMSSTIHMTVNIVGQNMISVEIQVLQRGKVLYQTDSVINLLNIKLKNGSIAGKTDGELDNPVFVFRPVGSQTTSA